MVTVPFPTGPIVLLGTDGADTLLGGNTGEILYGFGGNDSLSGGAGDDTIYGGSGTNRIDGGAGNDLIVIDRTATNGTMLTPADGVVAGDGYDTLQFLGNFAEFHVVNTVGFGLTITDLVGGARTIATGVEHLKFADLDIWLVDPNLNAPVISGVVTAGAVDGGLPVSVSLLAMASDPDPNAALAVVGLGTLPAGVSFDAMTSVVTLDPAAFQYLGAGVTEVVSLTYQVSDGLHVVEALAQLTVTGVNDAASFAGASAVITEDTALSSGRVVVSDADAGEAGLATGGVFAGAFGVFALQGGAWTYRLDTEALAVQASNAATVLTDTLAMASLDGTAGVLRIDVTGVQDAWILASGLVNGTGGADRLYGLDGADVLNGRAGADLLDGRGGADRLSGGEGNDRVVWDAADALADGGAGVDVLVVKSAAVVTLAAPDQVATDAGLTRGFEAVDAGLCLGAVSLTGSDGANWLAGGYGDDSLAGGRGSDVLTGGRGADSFHFDLRGGTDHVTDFERGIDHLVVHGRSFATWSELGTDTRIDLGTTLVVLDGVTGLTAADFLFV